jgi:hypothetical protein
MVVSLVPSHMKRAGHELQVSLAGAVPQLFYSAIAQLILTIVLINLI